MEKRSERGIEDSVARIFKCQDDPELEGESVVCDVIDFSSHGIRLKTPYALVPKTLLNITLGVGRPVSRFQLRGEILSTEIIENDCYLSILFSQEKGTDLGAWVDYLESTIENHAP